jgi:glycosyltransferase involved in cell wall biosynthesis
MNARVNYLGVDVERFQVRKSIPKENIVLSVGRTYPEKGYEFLIRALSYIPEPLRPDLVILADMCDPDEERYLSRLARQKQVTFRVENVFSDTTLVEWYNKAKLLIYAAYLEPLGLAPLEAMACGLPVVAVKEGGLRETVRDGETGFLTQRDPQEFAEKVRFLLEHPEVRKQYGKQARHSVETSWTWEGSVRKLQKHFQRIICPAKS